jgi:hypothetical protein
MMCCPDAAISTITGISLAVRTLGGSVGVSIYSAIYSNKIGQYLVTDISERVVEAGLPATAVPDFLAAYLTPGQNASLIEGVTPFVLEQAAIGRAWANAHAISFVWYASVAFAAISVVCCAFLPNIRQQMTNRVAVVSQVDFYSYTNRLYRLTMTNLGIPLIYTEHMDPHAAPLPPFGTSRRWQRLEPKGTSGPRKDQA